MGNALIVVSLDQDGRKLDSFFAKAKVIVSQGKNVERLSENVWLVNVQKDFHAFAKILAAVETPPLSYRILLFSYKNLLLSGDSK